MGIRFPAENGDYFETLQKGLSELAAAGALHALPGVGNGPLSAGAGHAVYALSPAATAGGGDPLEAAQVVAWRYVLFRGETPVATADVGPVGNSGALGLVKIQQGPLAGRFIDVVRAAEGHEAFAGSIAEVRALTLPEVEIEAMWLRGYDGDVFFPLRGESTETFGRDAVMRRWYERFPPTPAALRTIAGRSPLPAVLAPRPFGTTPQMASLQAVPPKTVVLNFLIQTQLQDNWCWLAVTASCFQFYNAGNPNPWTQCTLANSCLGQVTCCANPGSAACDIAGYPQTAMQTAGVWKSTTSGATPTWANVQTAINAGQPIVTGILQGGAVGHAQVIFGYTEPSVIYVADPWPGVGEFASDYTSYPGAGSLWNETFFSKSP